MGDRERIAIRINGIVQGVGFRPFIFNLALEHGLTGWVTNDSAGVLIEVEGSGSKLNAFLKDIKLKAPPLAHIVSIKSWSIDPIGDNEFIIRASDRSEKVKTLISPDMALCEDCYREMMDPQDRRYLYPFINCTNCGPRFTIIEEMPYDRLYTTMREFIMCPECQREYDDPKNRRFHAQPNACPVCGPEVWLTDRTGKRVDERSSLDYGLVDEVAATYELCEKVKGDKSIGLLPEWVRPIFQLKTELKKGKIAAVKGLGGYHLVCDALNREAVQNLRKRKYRPDKPLAVMMPNLDVVRRYCQVSSEEEKLLISPVRPIVLLKWKAKGYDGITLEVAPAQSRLGVMLPYTPLHYLLFDESLPVLVMTSGNISGEPIIYDDQEAVERLGDIVDYFLVHNRRIVRPCDDSVQRVDNSPVMIRRSRGYAPIPLRLPAVKEPILACGGEMNNIFALAEKGLVFMSQHIGDLKTKNSLYHYRRMIDEMVKLFEIEPEIVVHDLHPEYISTKFALKKYKDKRLIGVQHHHAHIASCMAEHGLDGQVIGLAFDGTGYGTDGKIWGGEILIASPEKFERWAHLKYLPLPGGDKGVKEPWRIGVAYLLKALPDADWLQELPFWYSLKDEINMLKTIIEKGIKVPETSSMGRLFDAVAAILGIRTRISYEGQAAIELEELAGEELGEPYPFIVEDDSPPFVINPLPIISAIIRDLRAGKKAYKIARRFHGTVVEMALNLCIKIRQELGLQRVVMSGGVFQNRLLSLGLKKCLEGEGFEVFQHCQVPTNDGGLALGQVYVASQCILKKEDTFG
ncbi:carbamoyltransferase HypF [Anoxybacter fermentans]|uniref:Carbamoyltransferase n=1 Tax=Anoxybacter fermentans TaxID=1323375 RepID=A0A3S9SXJ1_9FIRM|nr:carbamoyltransferase HypF [Anoxybacter fermentans]AZR72934.1 carbamoyltransferase HypF [Anoxybacter fermentans]